MTDFELARQIAKEIKEKHREAALPFILEEGETGLCDVGSRCNALSA